MKGIKILNSVVDSNIRLVNYFDVLYFLDQCLIHVDDVVDHGSTKKQKYPQFNTNPI